MNSDAEGNASATAKELLNDIEGVQARMFKTLGHPPPPVPEPDPKVINRQIINALIDAALSASEKGDDDKATNLLRLALKAMTT